ncbi:MAG: DUF4124 domain-containing protein [Pseudomonadota bacterium]
MQATVAAIMAAGTLTLLATPAQADKIMKWVDAAGVTHYGEKAPEGAKATTVKVTDTTSSDAAAEIDQLNKNRAATKAAKDTQKDGKPISLVAPGMDEANKKACEQHRQNLDTLKSGRRIRLLDAQGKPRALKTEEMQAQIEFAESELRRCEQLQKLGDGAAAAPTPKP